MQCVENCDDPNPKHHVLYEQPVWQTLQMFCTSHTPKYTNTPPSSLSTRLSTPPCFFCFRFLTSLLRSSRRNALLVSFISYSCLHRISLIHICFSSCFRLPSCSLFSPPKPMAACRPAPTWRERRSSSREWSQSQFCSRYQIPASPRLQPSSLVASGCMRSNRHNGPRPSLFVFFPGRNSLTHTLHSLSSSWTSAFSTPPFQYIRWRAALSSSLWEFFP